MFPGKTYNTQDIVEIARRRKWHIVIPFVLIAAGTSVVAHFMPNYYKAETSMLVVPQRVSESYVKSTVTTRMEDRLRSISQQILSRARLERVIQDFDLYPKERRIKPMEDVVEAMRVDIRIEAIKGDAFWVTYINRDPKTAMKVAERLASMFIEENLRDREVLAEGTDQFLEAHLDDSRRRLIEHEKKLEAYRLKHAGELPSQLQSNLQVAQSAQMQLQGLMEAMNRDQDRRLILQRGIADLNTPEPAPVAAPEPAANEALAVTGARPVDQLRNARETLRTMELRLKKDHPDVLTMKRVIRDLEEKVESEGQDVVAAGARPNAPEINKQTRIRELKAELENLDRQIAHKADQETALRDVIATYQRRAEAVPTRESELVELMRDYDTLKNVYSTLLAKKEDSKIATNLERRQIGEQFKILDPARLPESPFTPDRARINFFGALIGLALGVGLAALLEYRDSSLRSDEDVAVALQLPVLAVIPLVHDHADRGKRLGMRFAVSAAALIVYVGVVAAAAWRFSS